MLRIEEFLMTHHWDAHFPVHVHLEMMSPTWLRHQEAACYIQCHRLHSQFLREREWKENFCFKHDTPNFISFTYECMTDKRLCSSHLISSFFPTIWLGLLCVKSGNCNNHNLKPFFNKSEQKIEWKEIRDGRAEYTILLSSFWGMFRSPQGDESNPIIASS